jgi:quinol-cytochrome oxidoreductase complex cytochrome b subunit
MTRRRFWSVFPTSTREATDAIVANLLLHWFPARMRVASLAWAPSLWLGTVSWVLFVLLLLTGLPLMVFYIPSTRDAYQSIKDIEHVVSFGWWLRAAHRIAAHLMVIVVTLHVARVFLTGSYKNDAEREQHREWNWVIGVGLLAGTVLLSFTGYLLPWDQLAYWAVTVSMNIVASAPVLGGALRELLIGGRDIGQAALMRFYLLHIVALPIAVAALFGYHMWRIRKDGGLVHPQYWGRSGSSWLRFCKPKLSDGRTAPTPEPAVVDAIPAVVVRIAVVTMATWLAVTALAMVIPSPLEEAANPLVTPNPAKAPWYFLWLQEIVADTTLRVGPVSINGALVGGLLLPAVLLVVTTLWPWLDRTPASTAGVWLAVERRKQVLAFAAIAIAVAVLTVVGLLRGPSWQLYWPWQSWPDLPVRF